MELIRGAGGIVVRDGKLLLVHRPKYNDWTLPKGKLAPGESAEAGALREVEEETGLRCELGRELAATEYESNLGPKRVRYFAMRPVGGEFTPTAEVDELRWLAPEEAADLLTYDRDRDVVTRLRPERVLLVRHARAGERDEWEGDDRLRPLDAKGRRHAEKLVEALRPYRPTQIFSSPYVRCVQTVEPLAAALGLDVEEREELAEGAGPEEVDALLLKAAGETPVLCTHGDVIESLLGEQTKKGETTVLDADLRRVESIRPKDL